MTGRPTMTDVASAAGVSLKTVSRVVNNETSVSPETAGAVQAAIARLGFRPNHLARSLRQGSSSATLGLVIEDIGNPFYSQIARGVEAVARDHGFMLVTGSSEENPARERELVQSLVQRRVDALILVPARADHAYLHAELGQAKSDQDGQASTPVVFVDRPPRNFQADTILLDNRGGARQATAHLLAHGHRRIGLITGYTDVYTGAERVEGYQEALSQAGLPLDPELLREGRHDTGMAEAAAEELLALPDPPTALFTLNNRLSIGGLRAVWRREGRVALVGFDDFELADLLPTPVTVVRHDPVEMGRRAAALVFARLNGDTQPRATQILPVELVPRGSGELRPG